MTRCLSGWREEPLPPAPPPGGEGGQRGQEGNTRELAAQLAERALYPDPDADYVEWHTVDLSALEPFVACPHNPANVVPLSEVAGTKVDQAFLGTCTNGRLEDLAAAAAVLRGEDGQVKRIAAGTRMLVIPASSQVLREAMAAGYIETFLAAGAMLGTPGCGPCMGNHMGIPAPGEVTISSANRNFRGRMGTAESDVYLASPAVVAASAVAGRIVDPRKLRTMSDERRVMNEEQKAKSIRRTTPVGNTAETIVRIDQTPIMKGSVRNSQNITHDSPFITHRSSLIIHHSSFSGKVWKYGDNVNTDVIFPGKYTYTLREPAEWAKHALEDLDPSFAANVQPGDIIVGGKNWGSGSSREQAVGCLKAAGVQAIVAASFARIFFRNAVNNGLLPVACPEAVAAIQPGETIGIDLDRCVVICAAGEFAFPPLSDSLRAIVAAGGLIAMLKTRNP